MSWKNDVFSAIKDLASDIKTIRTIDSPDDLLPLGSDIANHIHQLIDVTVNSLDDSTHSKIIETAKAIKAAAPPLLKAVTSKNQALALELVEPLTVQLKELNQLLKAGDEPAAAGGSGVDVEECKKVQKEIKDALLLMNSAHKSKDEEKSKEAAKKLGEECKNLINLASAAGIDIKKSVIDAFKRIENDRVNGSNEQLQETLKEFHKVVKDAQKKLIPEEEKEKKEKSVKPKKPRTSNSQTTNSISNLVEKDDPTDLFTLTKKLGEGATGSVHMAVAKNSKVFAIKKVPLTMKNMEATQKEIKFMKNIHHANTLSYYNCYRRGTEVWIVMELCDGGSVQDILLTTGKGMEEPHIAAVTVQVLSGLEYLHGQQTIHRDIKSGNLLLTSEGKVKIADFGASADTCTNRTTVIGSAFWMAPETLDQSGYDTRADIWSLGITLIEMAEKNPPYFEFKSDFEVIKQIKNCEPATLKPNPKWSENFKQVVKVCLQRDRNKRPSATILLQHPFVKDITDTSGLAALVAEVHQLKKASKGDAAEPEDEVTVDSKPRKNSKKTDKPKEKRTSKSKTAGGPGTEEKVKVHFNSESNIAKRIAVEPSIDAQALAQKCYKQFKIDKEESSAYALYMIQNGTSKKLADNELPYQLLNSSKKDDIQLVYKKQ